MYIYKKRLFLNFFILVCFECDNTRLSDDFRPNVAFIVWFATKNLPNIEKITI